MDFWTGHGEIPRVEADSPHKALPPWKMVVSSAEAYLDHFDCQPLPLFCKSSLISSLKDRQPELLFAMLSLVNRLDNSGTQAWPVPLGDQFSSMAWEIVFHHILEGHPQLSTLQAMCLLSLNDIADCDIRRVRLDIELLTNVSKMVFSSRMLLRDCNYGNTEYQRCFCSIVILHHLYILRPESPISMPGKHRHGCLIVKQILRQDHCSDTDFELALETFKFTSLNPAASLPPDIDILTYLTPIGRLWFEARHYIMRRKNSPSHHPWLSDSDYAHLTAQQIRFGITFASQHRFDQVKFFDRTLDNLQQERRYWGPWLFVQFHYHAIICLLNHPLLLSMRIGDCRSLICQEFPLTAALRLEIHIEWITRLVEIIEERKFPISDPFIAHCVAIAATLLYQQMHSCNPEVSNTAQRNFQACIMLIDKLATLWPSVGELAKKLRCLKTISRVSYPWDQNLSKAELKHRETSIILNLLELSTTCEVSRHASNKEHGGG